MGTPEFAVPVLAELAARGHDIAAVYCQPPRPAGRGQNERKASVHRAAEALGLEVRTPPSLKGAPEQRAFAALQPDVAVVVAYGLILPEPVLEAPPFGCLNLHASKLPRWRGAAPIQRAIMAGDTATAVTVMKIDEGLDTGPVGLVEDLPIGPDTTAGDLQDEMMRRGADLMARALAALERGMLDFTPQAETGVTYAKKIDKRETRIDWSLPAAQVHNHIRGLSPVPGAWFATPDTKRVKALRSHLAKGQGASGQQPPGTVIAGPLNVACGQGAVALTCVQREGRAAMDAEAFVRGAGPLVGGTLG